MPATVNNPLLPAAYDITWSVAVVAVLLLMVIALISIARTAKRITSPQALIWTLVAIFVPLVGPLSWLFIGRRSANQALDTVQPTP
ncbi:PLD nuclease N-terminal domain-containing protein [Microbacterium sp. A196]|uniref:PLD nuclease N-terminal domain-containing protein n=1 Tax=unclassified Microbacterium TaxID=2609290 RepID=UPI003FD0E000